MIGKEGINHRKTIAQYGFRLKYIRYLIIFHRYPFIFIILPLKRVGFQKPQNTKKDERYLTAEKCCFFIPFIGILNENVFL